MRGVPSGHDAGSVPEPRPEEPSHPRKKPSICHSASRPRQPGITGSPLKWQGKNQRSGLSWQRAVLPAVEEKSIPTASVLREAHPKGLAGDTLTVEFPRAASFHRQLAEEPKNATLLAEALYEVTGRRLALAFEVGENGGDAEPPPDDEPASEEEIIELMKGTFDAREVSEE